MKKSKFYSAFEIKKMILEQKKLPRVSGNKGYRSPLFGGGDVKKITLR